MDSMRNVLYPRESQFKLRLNDSGNYCPFQARASENIGRKDNVLDVTLLYIIENRHASSNNAC